MLPRIGVCVRLTVATLIATFGYAHGKRILSIQHTPGGADSKVNCVVKKKKCITILILIITVYRPPRHLSNALPKFLAKVLKVPPEVWQEEQ